MMLLFLYTFVPEDVMYFADAFVEVATVTKVHPQQASVGRDHFEKLLVIVGGSLGSDALLFIRAVLAANVSFAFVAASSHSLSRS